MHEKKRKLKFNWKQKLTTTYALFEGAASYSDTSSVRHNHLYVLAMTDFAINIPITIMNR